MPIAYIQRTRERYAGYRPYRWVVNTDAPWTPLARPLVDCRLALVSVGGFYLDGQPPFTDNDPSYRLIPKSTDLKDLRVYHHAYRDDDVDRDPNCVFPLERLRELETAGVIGELADAALSFVNLYSARRELTERVPRIVAEMKRLGADAVLLVPVCPVCHQSVGLIAREIEKSGTPTLCMSSAFDVSFAVRAPRTVFVNFPLNHQTGKANDAPLQRRILLDALRAFETFWAPGQILCLPYVWDPDDASWEDADYGPGAELYGIGRAVQGGYTERPLRRAQPAVNGASEGGTA